MTGMDILDAALVVLVPTVAGALVYLARSNFALAKSRRFNTEAYRVLSRQLAEIVSFMRLGAPLAEPICAHEDGHEWDLEEFDHSQAGGGLRLVVRACTRCPVQMVRVVGDDAKAGPPYYRIPKDPREWG
jgi:hypothetical protein